MIGIPPTGGFFGKWHIILGAMEAGNYFAVAAVIVSSLLTMAYFQRLFVRVFSEQPASPGEPRVETHLAFRASVGVASAAILVLGLCSDPIVKVFRSIAASAGL
jgi:multicomponent Na+:H+ antiporter subunit D